MHHAAQYSLKTVVYAKRAPASSNSSFTPRFFHSIGAITCPFRKICSKNTSGTTNIRSPNFGPYSRPFLPMRSGNMRDALCHGCNNMVACCGIISSGTLPSLSNYEAPVPRFLWVHVRIHVSMLRRWRGLCCIAGHPIQLIAVRGTQTSWNVMDVRYTRKIIYTLVRVGQESRKDDEHLVSSVAQATTCHFTTTPSPKTFLSHCGMPQRPICCIDMCSDVMQWVLVTVPTQPHFLPRFLPPPIFFSFLLAFFLRIILVATLSVEPHTKFTSIGFNVVTHSQVSLPSSLSFSSHKPVSLSSDIFTVATYGDFISFLQYSLLYFRYILDWLIGAVSCSKCVFHRPEKYPFVGFSFSRHRQSVLPRLTRPAWLHFVWRGTASRNLHAWLVMFTILFSRF